MNDAGPVVWTDFWSYTNTPGNSYNIWYHYPSCIILPHLKLILFGQIMAGANFMNVFKFTDPLRTPT